MKPVRKKHRSPVIEFYALLTDHLDARPHETPMSYATLAAAHAKAGVKTLFTPEVLGFVRTVQAWKWKKPGQTVVEPHNSIKHVVFTFLRGAFIDLATLRRDEEGGAMRTYIALAHIILQEDDMYPVLFAQKLLHRGCGATMVIHISNYEQFLQLLMKHCATIGNIAEGGMLIDLTVPVQGPKNS